MSEGIHIPHSITGYLAGKLLIATPQLQGSVFERAVIYLCVHNADGAMGVIVNQKVDNVKFADLLEHLDITNVQTPLPPLPIHFGGPVEAVRGFILHSADTPQGDEIAVIDGMSLSASIKVLRDIAGGHGPKNRMLMLGYAGWSAGQLETEIQQGSWMVAAADAGVVFDADNAKKWARAGALLGVDPGRISPVTGRA